MFYRESLKATKYFPVCAKMQSAKLDERILVVNRFKLSCQIWTFEMFYVKVPKLPSITLCVLRCGVQSTTSVSLVIKKIRWNCQIWPFEVFCSERFKATKHLPVCAKMRSAKHGGRISD